MTSEKLLRCLSVIDEKYIEAVGDINISYTKPHKILRTITAIAACICIIAGCLFIFERTNNKPNADFIVENGALLSYCGTDTEITIPENVTAITDSAFNDSSVAADISTIHLNASVNHIDSNAFVNLTSLKTVTVTEENPYFESESGVLGKKDGSMYFGMIASYIDALDFSDTIEIMQKDTEYYGEVTDFIIGRGSLKIRFETVSNDFETKVYCYADSASSYGYNLQFDEPLQLYGNWLIYIYQTDEAFVISKTVNYDIAVTNWIFTENGIYEVANDSEYDPETDFGSSVWYNADQYAFELRDDGKLGYSRTPRKYLRSQIFFEQIRYCVATDEFCKETGYVSFENGQINYHPEKTYTASEIYDIQAIYSEWYSFASTMDDQYFEINNIPKTNSLEELLAYNSEKYKRAE